MTARRFASLCAAAAAFAGCEAPPRQVSDSGYGAYEVSMATRPAGAGLELAWYDTRDGNAEIYTRLLDASTQAEGADRRLTQTSAQSFEPDVATTEDGYVVAWYEKTAEGALRAQLGAWTFEGGQRWTQPLGSSARDTRTPLVRAFRDRLFVAWIEVEEGDRHVVWGQWRKLDGNAMSEPVRLAPAGPTTWNLNAAIDSRGVPFVVFDALVGTKAQELYLVEVAPGGPVVTRLGADDGHSSEYPDIAFSAADEVALAWFDSRDGNDEVYLAGGALADLRADLAKHEHRVTDTPGSSIGAYLAWNGARIGLAWSDDSSGQFEIYYRPFAVSGDALGAQKRVTDNMTNSLIPAIKAWQDGFALAWSEVTPAAGGPHDPNTRSEVLFSVVR
ncbi:MAG TPA: hypothetical protein VE907_19045 [Gammaproteobacteria bacterium]|nr:hypothetical protein [Gammaproteobacteria bacterium]